MNKTGRAPSLFALAIALLLTACGGGNGAGPSPAPVPAPSGLSYPTPQTFTVGSAITVLSPTVAGTVTSYGIAPELPAGLTLDTTNGSISGTPTAVTPMVSYTVTAQNSAGSTSFALAVTVNAADDFWLEPRTSTTVGVGQVINAYPAFKSGSDAYPSYVDAGAVTWTSSQPAIATIDDAGLIAGLTQGTTTITAQHQTFATTLTVTVAGTMQARNLTVAGQGTRRYSIYSPASLHVATAAPVIVALHGGGGNAMIQASTTLLNVLAQEQAIRVVYLEGTGLIQTFNAGSCCGIAQTQNVDDVAYARAVLDDIQARDTVDATKVFATGFSNGGMMSHRLACALSDRIAGIAAIGGASGQYDFDGNSYYPCNPTRPIPVLHVHGTNDRNYPYAGGFGDGVSSTNFHPIDATIADWIARNNVTSQPTIENVTATTTCYHYRVAAQAGQPSAPVALCKVDPLDVYDRATDIVFGGGHSWPGGVRSPAPNSDVPIADFNANGYLWSFLSR